MSTSAVVQAAQGIEAEFRVPKALDYLVGEKFLNFIEAADEHVEFRAEVPAFVAEIKTIFEPWQLAEYLEQPRQTEPVDPDIYDGDVELERQFEQRRSAADLLLGVNWYDDYHPARLAAVTFLFRWKRPT